MKIESLTDRFIPDDTRKQAEIKAESVKIFLEDAGYKDIVLSFSIQHPDKVIENEEILFMFCSKTTMQRLDTAINHLIAYRIKTHGEQMNERE